MVEAFNAGLGTPDGLMALYRHLNDRSLAKLNYDSDFGAALETRNLRMASNIREAIGNQPGSRTLVIVGASHKQYLEAYLHQMHDVHIVSSDLVLR